MGWFIPGNFSKDLEERRLISANLAPNRPQILCCCRWKGAIVSPCSQAGVVGKCATALPQVLALHPAPTLL